ncbi:hypothetical protein AB833_27175 [Chromatiales bacterium (ex Bugula neritina AB1)]|nr:hypothetical protein AB833_27175 [Chromatiales bacterium (ex Bugula neritina AB1)]
MLKPDGRVVMISGANRGIGLATAHALSAAGYQLSLGARDPGQLQSETFPGKASCHHWDAEDSNASTKWVNDTLASYGRIDAVVLNAGVIIGAGLENGLEQDMDHMWNVNFKGPLKLVRAALPQLQSCGHGRVINVVSLSGKRIMGSANLGYSASKFAALSLTHAIRQHNWPSGLRATAICPGLVDTEMVKQVNTPPGEFKISPDAIAGTIAYALSLPNDASVAEILVNSRLETTF